MEVIKISENLNHLCPKSATKIESDKKGTSVKIQNECDKCTDKTNCPFLELGHILFGDLLD